MNLLRLLRKPVPVTILLIGLLFLFADYNYRWKNDKWRYAVHTDAEDYYRYLPMIFVNHQFDGQAENPQVVKYFGGTAIAYLPFFTVAYYSCLAVGLPADGYSMLFPVLISIGTLFYFLAGLVFLSRFFRFYGISDWIICTVLITIAFGTIAFQYTVMAPGWAHIVAFGISCFMLYHAKKLFTDYNPKSIIALAASGSLLFFVRPTDVLIFMIFPFLANDFKHFLLVVRNALKERRAIAVGVILAMLPAICQLIIYRWGTGEFLVYSYTKEGFNFLKPEIANVLFSYSKGLFIYTPVLFLALFGLIVLFRINRYLFFGTLFFISVNVYVISSWWCWNYGASYGSRAFIEHYPIFFFCLALLLTVKITWLRIAVLVTVSGCIFLNIFQIWQANNGILDHDFKTTKRGYWHVFLRTDKGYSGKFYHFPADESPENILRKEVYYNNMENTDTSWINANNRTSILAHSGKYSSLVNRGRSYSTGKYIPLNDVPYSRNVLIRVSGWFNIEKKGSDAFVAISFVEDGKSINYSPFALDGYMEAEDKWEYKTFELQMPKLQQKQGKESDTRIEVYLCNNSGIRCFADDLKIEFIKFRKMERPLDLSWE